MSVSGEQSCPDNHSSFRCAAANKACNAQTSASSCVTSGTGICDIVIRMSGNAFSSCSLDVFSSIPVRETVRESSERGEQPAVRFPPPPLLRLAVGNDLPCPRQRSSRPDAAALVFRARFAASANRFASSSQASRWAGVSRSHALRCSSSCAFQPCSLAVFIALEDSTGNRVELRDVVHILRSAYARLEGTQIVDSDDVHGGCIL